MKKGEDYVGVTTSFFCHDGAGNYLMQKRSEACRDEHNRWDTGGGGLDHGDTVIDNVRKEIREEYCTEALDIEFLGYRDVHREHDGKKTHWISLDFRVLVDPTTVQNGEPHKFTEIGWFKLSEMPSPLHSVLESAHQAYKDKLV